ncbi:hypothetical protein Pyn_17219 [Prunus yedoensis var. nudiflora]|uniref:Uncharacterized protein n=1 Tax=Prunus yedoensis var. nudiflora TaxID=2094558 RepID=A0A314ZQ20_PRUYE|nr:hypothetical protein Pyn_17219 [Prunus yedoensis var. nudiflora]
MALAVLQGEAYAANIARTKMQSSYQTARRAAIQQPGLDASHPTSIDASDQRHSSNYARPPSLLKINTLRS